MSAQTARRVYPAPGASTAGHPGLLDLDHLGHQTLGDPELRAVILRLFLDEAPNYAHNIDQARDAKAWRMAVHTLKGVALNIGAFPLAQLCRRHELADPQADTAGISVAISELSDMIAQTCARIGQEMPQR